MTRLTRLLAIAGALAVLPSIVSMPAHAATLSMHSEPTRPHAMQDTLLPPAGEQPIGRGGAAPLSPSGQSTARAAAATTAPTGGGTGKLQRETFGFALGDSLGDPTVGYPSWDFSLLSTVAFFGLHVNSNGSLAQDSEWTYWNSQTLTDMVGTAHSHGTRVVLTIVLQDWSGSQSTMCAGLSNASTTISQTVAQVQAKGVDGVNVDYEGGNAPCGGQSTRSLLVSFVNSLRAALPAGSYLSVDTYASSAADAGGFFDVPGLANATDAFFVMAYDLDQSNNAPGCAVSYCLSPVAPLTSGYHYNDTSTVQQYTAIVPASKVILGVPYYGRKACVATPSANQAPQPSGSETADTYLDASTENTATNINNFSAHRDQYDGAGADRWDTWFNTTKNCWRELYWDDTVSLGAKYDLVNSAGLRGAGFWNLNYGGGSPDLWNLLDQKFTKTVRIGGYLASAPDATGGEAPSRFDVVAEGGDRAVWHAISTDGGQTYSWESLGGLTTSAPGITSWGPGRLDVIARGTDGAVWHRAFDGAWHPWESLGGQVVGGPDVASWAPGRLDVVVRGTDNHLWHKCWNGSFWSSWENLGGIVIADPTAVSRSAGLLEAFVTGSDLQMWHRWWDGHAWSSWQSLGGRLQGGPDATAWLPTGRSDVFVRGPDNQLWHRYFDGTTWRDWNGYGGDWTSDPAAVATDAGTLQVFERGVDGALWEISLTNQ